MLPLDHRIFVCSLRLLPFPLDYNFLISSRLSNFMFSTSTHMFWTSRFICFQLRFLCVRLRIRSVRLRIRNIRLRIRNIRLRIRNIRLRLKYYCSYFCPQRNAIHLCILLLILIVLELLNTTYKGKHPDVSLKWSSLRNIEHGMCTSLHFAMKTSVLLFYIAWTFVLH